MSVDIAPVHYRSHDTDYRFDVEVLDAAELRSRVAAQPDRGYERVDFQSFLFVEAGAYSHVLDFEVHECRPGSCLSIRPGQVHRFGPPTEWSGRMLIAAPHHVPAAAADLPHHTRLAEPLASAVAELLGRMAADARLPAAHDRLDALLALQTRVLVSRLALGHADPEGDGFVDVQVLERYREFRDAVELAFAQWHLVGPYARHLGCSAKTIDRATRTMSGRTAKRVIVDRIILEAKRLLAHGSLSVSSISEQLGFDEPTNFVKYFKRETDLTPAQFRRRTRREIAGDRR